MITAGFKLTMAASGGVIYYTTDGSDPREPVTGAVAPGATPYSAPVVLNATTHIKSRTLANNTWSALQEATFRLVEQMTHLCLTEIMYNPAGGSDYEFIELKNTGEVELNLSGMSFTGIRYTFPPHTPPLPPGALMVLVRNPAAFAGRYPNVAIGGVYRGQLSNKGETITLHDAEGRPVVSVTYDDENGWPVSPDGRGDSLVLANPAGDPNDPISWRASVNLYGSPGADEPVP